MSNSNGDPRDPWAAARGDPWYALRRLELQEKIDKGEELTKPEQYELKQISKIERDSGISTDKLLMAFILVKLSKTPKGLEVIKVLGREFIKGIFDTLHALGQASAANSVSAWANPYIVNNVLDRFGFVNTDASSEFKIGLSVVAGAKIAEGFIDTIQGIFPHTSPEPSEFPSSIVYSARTEGDTIKEEIKAKDASIEEIERFRKLWKPKEP